MKIVKLDIAGFGPLASRQMTFTDGMSVVHGPNESAKTAIHAAIFAGVCGIRRGQGQPKREDRAFEARHRPWDGGSWEVAAVVELADGRRIKLTHDLDGRIGSNAVDTNSGDDVSSEIPFEGSIDGSVWLGLNRRSFRATACIRQAEILLALADDDEHREDYSALQQSLQRAATSAGQRDETASAAIAALNNFWRENVGQDDGRSASRPFRRWKGEVAERERVLGDAEEAHGRYLDLLDQRNQAIAQRERRQREVRLAEAVIQQAKATNLEERIARAEELQEKHPAAPAGVSGDETLANKIGEALTLWDKAPPEQTLSGKTSAELRDELAALPERPDGALTPASEVLERAGDLEVARRLQAQPRASQTVVKDEAVRQEAAVEPAVATRADTWNRARVPMIAAVCLAVLGIAAIAVGVSAVGVALLVAAVAAAGASFWFLRPTAAPVRAAAPMPASQPEERGSAISQSEELAGRVSDAERSLLEALTRHGLMPAAGEPVDAAFVRYKAECGERESQDREARRRDEIGLLVERRLRAEAQVEQRKEAADSLLRAAEAAGLDDLEADLATLAATLRRRQDERRADLSSHDEDQHEWAELTQLRSGKTLIELKEQAQHERELAATTSERFAPADLDALDPTVAESQLPQLRQAFEEAVGEAATVNQLASTEGAKLKSIAEAEAELDEAEERFEEVVVLDETLKTTISFLTDAQQRVYETIAPTLQLPDRRDAAARTSRPAELRPAITRSRRRNRRMGDAVL